MTITRINENTLILELLYDELPLGNDTELAYHILNIAINTENIDTKNSCFLLEGVESGKGFVFLLTVKGKRKHYKVKRQNELCVYSFCHLEDFLSCICALYKTNSPLPHNNTYIMKDFYYICFMGKALDKGTRVLLSEYGKKENHCKKLKCMLDEHGHILTQKNSVSLIGESFICKEP